MNLFVVVETLQVIDEAGVRVLFADIMFPIPIEPHHLEGLGVLPLVEDELPPIAPGESLSAGAVRMDGEVARRGWQVTPAPASLWPAEIAARRYRAEVAGTMVNGVVINTERDSQALMTGAALQAMLDPNYHLQWKTPDGFVQLDAQQILAIAQASRAHVQACFDREATLLGELSAGTFEPSMLDVGWP